MIETTKDIEFIKKIIFSKKVTNCFNFYTEVLNWINDDNADAYIIEDSLFVFLRINGIYKFYYYVNKFEDLFLSTKILDLYRENSFVSLEFTTKNNKYINELSFILNSLKFNSYAKFIRFISAKTKNTLSNKCEYKGCYTLANCEDANEILKILLLEFDVLCDDIPTYDKLLKLINSGSVLIKKINGKIIFINTYTHTSEVIYSGLFWIDKEYRKPKFTVDIYTEIDLYFDTLNINWEKIRSYFWVEESTKAYKLHKKNGAKEDGLTCTIFTYK